MSSRKGLPSYGNLKGVISQLNPGRELPPRLMHSHVITLTLTGVEVSHNLSQLEEADVVFLLAKDLVNFGRTETGPDGFISSLVIPSHSYIILWGEGRQTS